MGKNVNVQIWCGSNWYLKNLKETSDWLVPKGLIICGRLVTQPNTVYMNDSWWGEAEGRGQVFVNVE